MSDINITLKPSEAMRLVEALARNASTGSTSDVEISIEMGRFLRVQGFHTCQVKGVQA